MSRGFGEYFSILANHPVNHLVCRSITHWGMNDLLIDKIDHILLSESENFIS
jgi:hypothetical protein